MADIVIHYGERAAVNLARLPEVMKEGALEALDEAADFMVNVAVNLVRVDTGTLQGSIRKGRRGDIVTVEAGGMAFVNPKTGKGCDYAMPVEARYPYMRPAWETVKPYVTQMIRKHVLRKVQEIEC